MDTDGRDAIPPDPRPSGKSVVKAIVHPAG
jgi:hypothetical protein